ncbi:ParA family protein [Pseudomonas aeruginosa]|uniref:ParA family protein n=1 Tax=Pseudomonas aeruginosa TaxID=287 RepID=UPI0009A27766|nr:AAA family ATPase [Pseudomonas aeruginosa]MBG3975770.1 ParA family protein [Pseudomonas aeruginosa]MBG5691572.1 ParA family protein [Pseudomonas aeruginosa]HCL3371523.1 ParA family protein [Pseudomonas aeruginosa]HCU2536177.1 ParA family protein [Pseudomonas aeruginosa]
MKIISVFNNKGGVGKTTYIYHIAHLLERGGKTVLLVDLDSQCNLSAYCLSDADLERSWRSERGNSIWNAIERVYSGLGDIRTRQPTRLQKPHRYGEYQNMYLVPGDVMLSSYEDRLGDTWSSARGGDPLALRVQSAIYRYILWCADNVNADVVLLDLGPNLGSLNRAVLGASDYFVVPVSPDLFSIRGTENLGSKLKTWRSGWDQCNENGGEHGIELPRGRPSFLGYVKQQHNIRANASGMTRGWNIFGERTEDAVQENIVARLDPIGQVYHWPDGLFDLGSIPNLHSLIPYSQEARKPIFDCTGADGLTGAHISRARDSVDNFQPIVTTLINVLDAESNS